MRTLKKLVTQALAWATFAAVPAALCCAQNVSLSGRVIDDIGGSGLKDVAIQVLDPMTPTKSLGSTNTDKDGNYSVTGLSIGSVNIWILKVGFSMYPTVIAKTLGAGNTVVEDVPLIQNDGDQRYRADTVKKIASDLDKSKPDLKLWSLIEASPSISPVWKASVASDVAEAASPSKLTGSSIAAYARLSPEALKVAQEQFVRAARDNAPAPGRAQTDYIPDSLAVQLAAQAAAAAPDRPKGNFLSGFKAEWGDDNNKALNTRMKEASANPTLPIQFANKPTGN